MKRYAKTALWITFGLLFVLIIVKVFTLMYELNSAVRLNFYSLDAESINI